MENRRETLGFVKICRFCLAQNRPLGSLYEKSKSKTTVTLPLKILSSVSIEVLPSDKKPTYICDRCKFFMNLFFEYKYIVRQADESILQYVQNGAPLGTVNWPSSLTKIYRQITDSETVKTVVEGGATIQVTSHDISESDEEDGNVYNVKIGDDEDAKTCVKVVTSKDTKAKENARGKGFGSITKLARHVRTHVSERPYPCKYCAKSFTKSHHYTRHIRLKHRDQSRSSAGALGAEQFRCEQCDDAFESQDELIYHSAIHATQNLTCPLCQEKFADVEAVTAHIKSHVNGVEFMCDYCELIFTTQEKLDTHQLMAHDDEINHEMNDESSMEMEAEEDDDDDNGINLKEDGDDMIIEIKKPDNYLVNDIKEEIDDKMDNTNSEESESEVTYTELQTVDTLAILTKDAGGKPAPAPAAPTTDNIRIYNKTIDSQSTNILRKAEEIKRKFPQSPDASDAVIIKKSKPITKMESSNSGGASDKSLRLLEKELQDLKRTNSRNTETTKASSNKVLETIKGKRPQFQTSTPKLRSADDRKQLIINKQPPVEKKQPEKRAVTKENKEPKETKDVRNNNGNSKEEKDNKEKESNEKDTKEKEKEKNSDKDKGKETPKNIVKNGSATERTSTEEGVRRSTRPSKIKDYAKMIRDRTLEASDDETTEDDEDYQEPERSTESRRGRRVSQPKAVPAAKPPPAAPGAAPRKRGRPRKEPKEVPEKIKKPEPEEDAQVSNTTNSEKAEKSSLNDTSSVTDNDQSTSKTPEPTNNTPSDVLVSPTGQTLKKVTVRELPPGIKAMPLPANARPMPAGELCQMQIGKKVVKVQKIVMTKAEVEAMAKKGLVEMKDGTMVLKQGIKLPTTTDASTVKSTLMGDGENAKESTKKEKAAPTRCDLGDES